MNKWIFLLCIPLLAGCEQLRYGVNEDQRQNAWLHHRTAQIAAGLATDQNCSEQLQGVASLSELLKKT
jgi:hypothetical protein